MYICVGTHAYATSAYDVKIQLEGLKSEALAASALTI